MDGSKTQGFAGDGLLEIYQALSAEFERVGMDKVPGLMMCGLSALKLAMLMMAEASHPGETRALFVGQEKLHAGDAMVQAGAVCTGAAALMHHRLINIPGRHYTVQRAGKLMVELNAIAIKLTKHGYALSEEAEARRATNA